MRIIFLVLLVLAIRVPLIGAWEQTQLKFEDRLPLSITGTISAVGSNMIEIIDESDGRAKRLAYFGREEFKAGERVRVWFDKRFWTIEQIQRMTPVAFEAGQSNAGYLYKKE